MEIIKIRFKPRGLFGTNLSSDTLFGHICWSIKYIYGEDELLDMLYKFNNGKPWFLLSSGFPDGFLPKPVLPTRELKYEPNKPKKEVNEARKKMKDSKKNDLALFSDISNNQKSFNPSIQYSYNKEKFEKIKINNFEITRNSINRETFTVLEGYLFTDNYYWTNTGIDFISYLGVIDNKYDKKYYEKIFDYLSRTGIGKDKSIGKGLFDITIEDISEEEKNLFSYKSDYFISLSHSAGADLNPLSYHLFIKYGKVGEEFATSGQFYKKPIVFYKNGALFKGQSGDDIYGGMVKNIHTNKDIVQYGYCFPLYINYSEE